MRVVSVDEMRAIERRADEEYGLDSPTLMEHAGRSVAEALRDRLGGDVRGLRVVTLAGPGNNGGDGRVMNRYLAEWGAHVMTWRWRDNMMELAGGEKPVGDDLTGLGVTLAEADVVADALLGTGHARPLDPRMRQALALVGELRERQAFQARPGRPRPFVLAVDLPSGVNADTGAADEGTLRADLTVTLAFPKTGLTLFPGAGYLGELVVGSIGLPAEMSLPAGLEMLSGPEARALLPQRPADSNKGTYGKVMVLAGSPQFIGAAALCGASAARVGAGLVTIATTPERAHVYAASLPEVTYLLLPPDDADPAGRAQTLLEGLRGYDALVVGPGLSQAPGIAPMLLALFAGLRGLPDDERPHLLVDADGLNALAKEREWWRLLPAETVITPHPGEMARLRGGEHVSSGGADRLSVAAQVARDWNLVVILKGACPLIARPDGALRVNWSPNPALATAGTGDVLSGVIGGLLAQGLAPWDAASLGVYLHGRAGARVRDRLGVAGPVAPDLIPELPLALRETRGGR
ncbi:MAG TPA: NAD(P)H-hydrate dehydratase [Ktedonobacterales bacterium]|nr:NAD(P)H-hydrate dehydratase [Ktedonobacterales bacterium]